MRGEGVGRERASTVARGRKKLCFARNSSPLFLAKAATRTQTDGFSPERANLLLPLDSDGLTDSLVSRRGGRVHGRARAFVRRHWRRSAFGVCSVPAPARCRFACRPSGKIRQICCSGISVACFRMTDGRSPSPPPPLPYPFPLRCGGPLTAAHDPDFSPSANRKHELCNLEGRKLCMRSRRYRERERGREGPHRITTSAQERSDAPPPPLTANFGVQKNSRPEKSDENIAPGLCYLGPYCKSCAKAGTEKSRLFRPGGFRNHGAVIRCILKVFVRLPLMIFHYAPQVSRPPSVHLGRGGRHIFDEP